MKANIRILLVAAAFVSTGLGNDAVQEDGSIVIKPGEGFVVQFERVGDKLSRPRIVEKMVTGTPCIRLQCASGFSDAKAVPPKPDRLLGFMLGENPNQTILLLQKNFPETVVYSCHVKPSGSMQFEARKNLTLQEMLPMLEQYPQKLDAIKVDAFRVREG